MPNRDFWTAVERLLGADESEEQIAEIAADLVGADASLGTQLQETIRSLDTSALAVAARLSDGLGESEDAMIAVACAVISAGQGVYAEALRDPRSLAKSWDLSRGDLLLELNPAVSLHDDEASLSQRSCRVSLSIDGESELGWLRHIIEAVAYHQSRQAERSARWRSLLHQQRMDLLIIHLVAAAGRPQKVGKPYSHHDGCLETVVTWNPPRSPLRVTNFVSTVLDAVATRLEGA